PAPRPPPSSPTRRSSDLGPASGPESARELSPAFRTYYDNASDRLDRAYAYPAGAAPATVCKLWMIHYRDGQDRNHHPQVCYQTRSEEHTSELQSLRHLVC